MSPVVSGTLSSATRKVWEVAELMSKVRFKGHAYGRRVKDLDAAAQATQKLMSMQREVIHCDDLFNKMLKHSNDFETEADVNPLLAPHITAQMHFLAQPHHFYVKL